MKAWGRPSSVDHSRSVGAPRRRLWRAWPILFLALVVTTMLSALFRHLLRTVANQIG